MIFNRNEHLASRIESIFTTLQSGYDSGISMSSASKGMERELFVTNLLKEIYPPHFRFSSGDITDSSNRKSGQVDIVLEHAHGFSFPMLPGGPRLFLAESVASVIEVKSNLSGQWNEVCETAKKVKDLNRKFAHQRLGEFTEAIKSGSIAADLNVLNALERVANSTRGKGESKIPVYAVGYKGWKTLDKLQEKVETSEVDGIFVIGEKLYLGPTGKVSGLNSMLAFLQALESDFQKKTAPLGATMSYRA